MEQSLPFSMAPIFFGVESITVEIHMESTLRKYVRCEWVSILLVSLDKLLQSVRNNKFYDVWEPNEIVSVV